MKKSATVLAVAACALLVLPSTGLVASASTVGTRAVVSGATTAPATPDSGVLVLDSIQNAAKRITGSRLRIRIGGQRYGKSARITVKGYRGKAKGTTINIRVKTKKTLKRLQSGKYKITTNRVYSGGAQARAEILEGKRVKITKRRGAVTKIAYRQKEPTRLGAITLASTNKNGKQTKKERSYVDDFSPDGKKIAFTSAASNLVPKDTNGTSDVFVKVLATGEITRISTTKYGKQGSARTDDDWGSRGGVFSPDGRTIAFTSDAPNLVPGDPYDVRGDVFLKVLASGAITRVNTTKDGQSAAGESYGPVFSPDGTKIAFSSVGLGAAPFPGSMQGLPQKADLFVKDLATGTVQQVSTNSSGDESKSGLYSHYGVAFSPDSKSIAFRSNQPDLVTGDTNGRDDVFLKHLATGKVTRVSTDGQGRQATGTSRQLTDTYGTPVFSPDGTRIAFSSTASNLVIGDTNGVNDVFVKHLASGKITRVSTNRYGKQVKKPVVGGQFVSNQRIILVSKAKKLVEHDTNGEYDVFLKRLNSGRVKMVSTDRYGNQSTGYSSNAVASPLGTKVAFSSTGSSLVPNDTNHRRDVFVKTIK